MEDLYRLRQSARAPLVLGCMNFGKRTPEADARRIIDIAFERGIRHFDVANAYVDGVSEQVVGRALAARRGDVHIATKVGWWRKEGLGAERIKASLDRTKPVPRDPTLIVQGTRGRGKKRGLAGRGPKGT